MPGALENQEKDGDISALRDACIDILRSLKKEVAQPSRRAGPLERVVRKRYSGIDKGEDADLSDPIEGVAELLDLCTDPISGRFIKSLAQVEDAGGRLHYVDGNSKEYFENKGWQLSINELECTLFNAFRGQVMTKDFGLLKALLPKKEGAPEEEGLPEEEGVSKEEGAADEEKCSVALLDVDALLGDPDYKQTDRPLNETLVQTLLANGIRDVYLLAGEDSLFSSGNNQYDIVTTKGRLGGDPMRVFKER